MRECRKEEKGKGKRVILFFIPLTEKPAVLGLDKIKVPGASPKFWESHRK